MDDGNQISSQNSANVTVDSKYGDQFLRLDGTQGSSGVIGVATNGAGHNTPARRLGEEVPQPDVPKEMTLENVSVDEEAEESDGTWLSEGSEDGSQTEGDAFLAEATESESQASEGGEEDADNGEEYDQHCCGDDVDTDSADESGPEDVGNSTPLGPYRVPCDDDGGSHGSSDDNGSEYIGSDDDWDLVSDNDSDDFSRENTRTKAPQYPAYKRSAKNPALELGMLFTDALEFKTVVALVSMRTQRAIVWTRNHRDQVKAVCSGNNCPWEIYASWNNKLNSFQVKTYNNSHCCNKHFKPKLMSARLIADLYHDLIVKKPFMKVQDLMDRVKEDFEVDVNFAMARRAKKEVVDEVALNYSLEYSRLWDYAQVLRDTNPGTTVVMQAETTSPDQQSVFKRYYICFGAVKEGWNKGCRPYIGPDGCFLKTTVKGELLCAVSRDGNNHMFPVAWALVEVECTATWRWFISLVADDLNLGPDIGLTVMTDQQKGLDNAIKELLPDAEHRFCARHIYSNWVKRGHRGHHKKLLFWEICKGYNVGAYERAMAKLKEKDPAAATDLLRIPKEKWCRAFFEPYSITELVDNNMCEAFNNVLLNCRRLPIVSMFERMRIDTMDRIARKRAEASRWNASLGPKIWNVLDTNGSIATAKCTVVFNGQDGYEVSHGSNRYVVKLESKSCSCGKYTISGLPCEHAIAAIRHKGDRVEDYASSWYDVDTYMEAYNYPLQPIPGMSDWPVLSHLAPVQPPPQRVMPGRPKLLRRKDPTESKKVKGSRQPSQQGESSTAVRTKLPRKGNLIYSCTNCGAKGHNARGCTISGGSQTGKTMQKGKPPYAASVRTTAVHGTARAVGRGSTAYVTNNVSCNVHIGHGEPPVPQSESTPTQTSSGVRTRVQPSNEQVPIHLYDAEGRFVISVGGARGSPKSRNIGKKPATFNPDLARASKRKKFEIRRRSASGITDDWVEGLNTPGRAISETFCIGTSASEKTMDEAPVTQSSQSQPKVKGKGKDKV